MMAANDEKAFAEVASTRLVPDRGCAAGHDRRGGSSGAGFRARRSDLRSIDQSGNAAAEARRRVFEAGAGTSSGPQRYALLFKPGTYTADVQVGFYTQVAGLGTSPDDVTITGAVRATAGWANGNATTNFWRSIENLTIRPDRAQSHGRLGGLAGHGPSPPARPREISTSGKAAGQAAGSLADSQIDGAVTSGSQQQWVSRNVNWGPVAGRRMEHGFRRRQRPAGGRVPAEAVHRGHEHPGRSRKAVSRHRRGGTLWGRLSRSSSRVRRKAGTGRTGRGRARRSRSTTLLIARPERDTAATMNAGARGGQKPAADAGGVSPRRTCAM